LKGSYSREREGFAEISLLFLSIGILHNKTVSKLKYGHENVFEESFLKINFYMNDMFNPAMLIVKNLSKLKKGNLFLIDVCLSLSGRYVR